MWFICLRLKSATCQNNRSKLELRLTTHSTETVCLERQTSNAVLHWCKTGEWSYGECSNNETRPTAELSNVKNGILGPQGLHPGSICSEGGWSQWLKSALREARCNQASKMRMTTSTRVDWSCLAASLSAGHHQERLLGQPLWPLCGFKFPFEGRVVSRYIITKPLIQKLHVAGRFRFADVCYAKKNEKTNNILVRARWNKQSSFSK